VAYRVNGGGALYGAYAAGVNLDSSALKDRPTGVDCSTTGANSSLLRFEPQKSGGMLVLKNRQHEIYIDVPPWFCYQRILDQHVQAGYQHEP